MGHESGSVPNKRLKYSRIGSDVMEIYLQNGYTIIAISWYVKTKNVYETTLYIRDNTTRMLDMMEAYAPVEIEADSKTIRLAVLKYVEQHLAEGGFNDYITRYGYMLQCFDRGNELFEQEEWGVENPD